MHATNFILADYLARIHYSGPTSADLITLHALMEHQLYSVPFENLDVQAGKIVSLVPEDIVDKIVYRQRGGYCYEVNGVFAMALTALGIPYQFVAARPMFYPVIRPKTHMALVVTLEGQQWLCDLGFGSYGLRQPLLIDDAAAVAGYEVEQGVDRYSLSKIEKQHYLLQAWSNGAWARQYAFDLYAPEWIDFVPANHLNSTHPEAIFVQKPLIVLFNPTGRKILLGDSLKQIDGDKTTQTSVSTDEFDRVLRQEFGLRQPA